MEDVAAQTPAVALTAYARSEGRLGALTAGFHRKSNQSAEGLRKTR
jgi:hypothetical protein